MTKRPYTQTKRADRTAQTRQRIVEAAVDLHSHLGPGATTLSMVAEKAGVQRHTLYAHFPDERALLMACSGHSVQLDPPPNAHPWRNTVDPRARLTVGLSSVYAWYARNETLIAGVLRDAQVHPLVKEVSDLRYGPDMTLWHEVLGAGLDRRRRALLAVALSYHTWRTLERDAGLDRSSAVMTMAAAVMTAS